MQGLRVFTDYPMNPHHVIAEATRQRLMASTPALVIDKGAPIDPRGDTAVGWLSVPLTDAPTPAAALQAARKAAGGNPALEVPDGALAERDEAGGVVWVEAWARVA